MDNWENNFIANKLNNLRDLPKGYKPNLASKWEIIEAGLPKEKRAIPLFKWSIAAAMIIGCTLLGLFLKSNFKKQTIALRLLNTGKQASSFGSFAVNLKQTNTIDKSINLNTTNKNKIIIINHSDKQLASNHQNKKSIIVDSTPILASIQKNNAILATTVPAPTLITLNTVPIIKQTKRKIYQKDFNDNTLKVEDANMASQSKTTGLKLQLLRHSNYNTEQSPSVIQFKKSF